MNTALCAVGWGITGALVVIVVTLVLVIRAANGQ